MINIQDLLEEAGVQSWEAERQGYWAQAGRGAGEVLLLQGLPALQAQQPGCPAGPWLPGELALAALKGLIESTYYLNGCEARFLGRCLAAVLGIEGETQHRDCGDD